MNHLTFSLFDSGPVCHSSKAHWFDDSGFDDTGFDGLWVDSPEFDGPWFDGSEFDGLEFGFGLSRLASGSARS